MQEKGISPNTKYIINFLGEEKQEEIDIYIKNILNEEIVMFKDFKEIQAAFNDFLNVFYERISIEEKEYIQNYTGLSFRKINSFLRGIWDYEKNGLLNEDEQKEAREQAYRIRKALIKAPILPYNMLVYRGVGIESFYAYGINTIDDLTCLKDKFIYENGFTSTSLLRSNSFYEHKPEWGGVCNVEIECLIPRESEDGVPLIDSTLSYSENQLEFLINSSSLFKVIDVQISNNTARLKTILIPQKLWNPLDYEIERNKAKLV